MGGDHGLSVTVPACISFVNREKDAVLVLVGLEGAIRDELKKHKAENHPRLQVKNASEVVTMDDPLEIAMRRKKGSSMRVAIQLVKDAQVQACVSAGNTGALMAISRYILKTLPGVDRPAICGILPNQKNSPTYMLDLGANVDCEAKHLQQFALMGSALFSAMENKPKPKVGLLNVGVEEIKGNEVVKQATELLRADHNNGVINFYGNIEGNDIFEGTADVVVCDGFVGNVALKSVEGLGRFFRIVLISEFKSSLLNMIGAVLARRALKAISQRLNPSRFNGANLMGLRGLVFKSHGGADAYAYEFAIKRAFDAVRNDVLLRISTTMADLLLNSDASSASGNSGIAIEPTEQKIA